MLPTLALPDTLNELNVPKLVIFGCDAVVIVPTKLVAPMLPTLALPLTVKLVNIPAAAPTLPILALPLILNDVSVPTLVIVGCATLTLNTLPVNVNPEPA